MPGAENKMPIRLIQYHGSVTGRRGWLGPIVIALAALGATVLLSVVALTGLVLMAAGGVIRLLTITPTRRAETGHQSFPAFLGGVLKRLFFKGGATIRKDWREQAPWGAAKPGDGAEAGTADMDQKKKFGRGAGGDEKTISLDRGKDGIWRP